MTNKSHEVSPMDHVPPAYYHDDEIHLGELIKNLIARKTLIIGITIVGTLIAITVSFILTKQYDIKSIISVPDIYDIQLINQNGLEELTTDDVFQLYVKNINSRRLLKSFYLSQEFYLNESTAEIEDELTSIEIENMFAQFSTRFSTQLEVPEYLEVEKGALNPTLLYSVGFTSNNPVQAANFLNDYLAWVHTTTIAELHNNQTASKRVSLKKIENRIKALLARTVKGKATQIILIQDAIGIAKQMNIEEPFGLQKAMVLSQDFGQYDQELSFQEKLMLLTKAQSDSEEDGFEFEEAREKDSPEQNNLLYLKGTKALEAELVHLKQRKDDLAYIPEIRQLNLESAKLDVVSLDFTGAQMAKFEQNAYPPKSPIKPNKKLIVVIAFVGSLFFGIFAALIAIAVSNDEKETA